VTAGDENRATLAALVPPVAAVAIIASVLGRAVGPALRGAGEGIDSLITYANLAGSFATYLFAFTGLVVLILQLAATFRETRLSIAYRSAAAVGTACIVALVVYAFRGPLSDRANILAAIMSGALALYAGREALYVPHTRVIGLILGAAAIAAILHVAAVALNLCLAEPIASRFALLSGAASAASVLFDAGTLLIAFLWLTTRPTPETPWIARGALFVSFVVAWGAVRGAHEGAPLWELVASRAVDRLLSPSTPAALVWHSPRVFLETTAPLLGAAVLVARGQMPAVTGALALALVARPSTDIPLSAMALVLAALSAPLAARDQRGMWASLLSGRPGKGAENGAAVGRGDSS
jgi:hypothetical protein